MKLKMDKKEYMRNYYLANKNKPKSSIEIERKRETTKKWDENNKIKKSEYQKEWYKLNKERLRKQSDEYHKNRMKSDTLFKLTKYLKSGITKSLKRMCYTKKSRSHEILGCSYDEFKLYIESKWEPWMTWDNYGKYNGNECFGWDIDHYIPVSSAKTEEALLKLLHYSNLQPLCSKINRDIKKAKSNY
jgi:hypothetical protein